MNYINKIIQGDVIKELKKLPSDYVDLIITSPPYYGLRNYGVDGQIGLEETFDDYLNRMMKVIAELKRVLKPTGQFWLNMGDCYSSNGKQGGDFGQDGKITKGLSGRARTKEIKEKCMLMQPERMAIKMIDNGWILRNKVKWAKQIYLHKKKKTIGSVMPTSVKDRFNESGEELYFFVKNKKYYSDLDAVRIKNQVLGVTDMRAERFVRSAELYYDSKYNKKTAKDKIDGASRYAKGSEFEQKYGEPWDRFGDKTDKARTGRRANNPELGDRNFMPTKSRNKVNDPRGNSEGGPGSWRENLDDQKYRKEWRDKTTKDPNARGVRQAPEPGEPNAFHPLGKNLPTIWQIGCEPHNYNKELGLDIEHFAAFPQALVEIPIKFGCPKKGIVLDPFMGSGTTALVAQNLGRNYIGIELNPNYIKIANERLKQKPLI